VTADVDVVEHDEEEPTGGAGSDAAPAQSVPFHRRLPGGRTLRDGRRLYWWGELVAAGLFYAVYSFIRNLHHGTEREAFDNAIRLIDLQKTLGIYHEQAMQEWARGWHAGIVAANYFYGSLHFIVTIGVLVFLYRKWTDDYPLWRNTIAIATALALIGFAFFPLMPPRLMPEMALKFHYTKEHFTFFDTLAKDPAFWSFNSGAVNKISNQFAAMPSVHCAWAGWCTCALVPRLRHGWAKALAILYPICTVTVIVVTANHYVLDAVGGFTCLALGYLLARTFTRAGRGSPVAPATPGTPATSRT
jgi:hypothetical protein